MIILTVVFLAFIVNYGRETVRNRAIRIDRRDRSAYRASEGFFEGGSLRAAAGKASARVLETSDDPEIEHQRRITVGSFILGALMIPVWMVGGPAIDGLTADLSRVSPLFAVVPAIATIITALSARGLVQSIAGPERAPLPAIVSAVGLVSGIAALAAARPILGA